MRHSLRPAIVSLLVFTVLTGLIYPLTVTGLARLLFPHQAGGSLIVKNGHLAGSSLVGQPFDDPRYFWGRPSATAPFAYNGASSAGSNLGPSNPALRKAIKARVATLRDADPDIRLLIPVDLVTASGSGLDPLLISARLLPFTRFPVSQKPGASMKSGFVLLSTPTSGTERSVSSGNPS